MVVVLCGLSVVQALTAVKDDMPEFMRNGKALTRKVATFVVKNHISEREAVAVQNVLAQAKAFNQLCALFVADDSNIRHLADSADFDRQFTYFAVNQNLP